MIKIENAKKYCGKGEYVGRSMPGRKGSALGNPFKGNRAEVIQKYRRWLWEKVGDTGSAQYKELIRLHEIWKTDGSLTLICWCAPLPCHADVIARAIRWVDNL